jgi:PRC-barrel domain
VKTPRIDTVKAWRGRSMVDPAGGKIGTLVEIYLDDDTGQPEWATVTTGLFGTGQSFVPLAEAEDLGDGVQVPYDRERVKSAPGMRAEVRWPRMKRPRCIATTASTIPLPLRLWPAAVRQERTSASAATCGALGRARPVRPDH